MFTIDFFIDMQMTEEPFLIFGFMHNPFQKTCQFRIMDIGCPADFTDEIIFAVREYFPISLDVQEVSVPRYVSQKDLEE